MENGDEQGAAGSLSWLELGPALRDPMKRSHPGCWSTMISTKSFDIDLKSPLMARATNQNPFVVLLRAVPRFLDSKIFRPSWTCASRDLLIRWKLSGTVEFHLQFQL